jgi:tetratricopeptide (TPR) repeat protein
MRIRVLTALTLVLAIALADAAKAEKAEHVNKLLSTNECQKCNLRGAGFVFSDLSGANLTGADLSNANLSRANLSGAILKNANLQGASFLGANLNGTNFSGANLTGADLNGTDLTGANLKGTNLSRADLRNANLLNADLEGANLENAFMRGAVGISAAAGKPIDFYGWGLDEARRGNQKGAIELFNQSLALDPKFAFSYLARSISRQKIGDLQGAIADSKSAEQYFTEINHTEGIKVSQEITKALQTPPDNGGGGNFFSDIFMSMGSIFMQMLLR